MLKRLKGISAYTATSQYKGANLAVNLIPPALNVFILGLHLYLHSVSGPACRFLLLSQYWVLFSRHSCLRLVPRDVEKIQARIKGTHSA
jgi:hypothetical protein